MTDLVTVANFDDSAEAHIFKGRLLAEGILAFVIGDFPAALRGGFCSTQVNVRTADLERARAIYRAIRNSN